jgi:hypothetical protein
MNLEQALEYPQGLDLPEDFLLHLAVEKNLVPGHGPALFNKDNRVVDCLAGFGTSTDSCGAIDGRKLGSIRDYLGS